MGNHSLVCFTSPNHTGLTGTRMRPKVIKIISEPMLTGGADGVNIANLQQLLKLFPILHPATLSESCEASVKQTKIPKRGYKWAFLLMLQYQPPVRGPVLVHKFFVTGPQ